jgi:hypothetical protein
LETQGNCKKREFLRDKRQRDRVIKRDRETERSFSLL